MILACCLFQLCSRQGGQPLEHDIKQPWDGVEARAVEGPAWSVSEPSIDARLEVLDWVGPVFYHVAFFLFVAGKEASPWRMM